MRNVSFDNPWWLLIAIPLAAAVVLPYLWAIRKENKSKASLISLILHIVIVGILALAAAGTTVTTYMTKTEVVFVADVSYSANKNLDLIDDYIAGISKELPKNTQSGLVCFGKDYKLVSDFGEKLPSVKNSGVDDSATDISSALNYAATLFSGDTIKHIVLLTDGNETDPNASSNLVRAVEELYANNVYIDVVYINSNLLDGETEVQLTSVEATAATYLDRESKANVLIQTGAEMEVAIKLYKNGQLYSQTTKNLPQGYHIETFTLDTSGVGTFDYEVVVEAEGDASPYNNSCSFTQMITGSLHVLLITGNEGDVAAVDGLYNGQAQIDSYVNDVNVPCTVEQLCKYDTIILSETDVSKLENASAFIDSLDKVVSVFGKSLINIGDSQLQNATDDASQDYASMLPVKYGNSAQDSKLYAIVMDTSRSMNFNYKLSYAKRVAENLLNILNDDDQVLIIGFSGEPKLIYTVSSASNRADLVRAISQVSVTQGTVLGAAMQEAYKLIAGMDYENKQVMLISDGLSYSLEKDDPVAAAQQMAADGITVSTVNVCTNTDDGIILMQNIAEAGGGKYYYVNSEDTAKQVVYDDIAPELGATVIEKEVKVSVSAAFDTTMSGVGSLPNIHGYVQSKAKSTAITVLTVPYQKSSGAVTDVPLYAYWSYGNGKAACFTSDLLSNWAACWKGTSGETFLANVLAANVPEARVDYPYTLNVEYDGVYSLVEVIPVTINPYAALEMTITMPDGTAETKTLYFDQTRYYYEFSTPELGKYQVEIHYSYGSNTYVNTAVFHIDRSPEYDSFVLYSPATLTSAVRDRGTVYADGSNVKVENNMDEVSTYTVEMTIILLAIAVGLYVIDIIIRKLTLADIRGLFKKTAVVKGG